MVRVVTALFVSALWITGSTETIELKGMVKNSKSKPIVGANVSLLVQKNLNAKTNSSGEYTISANVATITPAPRLPNTNLISIKNSSILINLAKPGEVRVELFDMHGKLLERTIENAGAAGTYRFDLRSRSHATGMLAVKVTTGSSSSTFRSLPFKNGSLATEPIIATNSGERLAKIAAAVDSLVVSAGGYKTKKVAVTAYTSTVDVTLDTMPLAKFSFFLTSLAAIQALSKSEDGFGGDFRFGKTGQGAGLLGADSICQCIAERSMPGSAVKQWRAFLSVSKGPDGKQVNAIDRIGNGPWYDRLERVVALTKADLAHPRPLNIDDDIKNDLPNEDGVPNHRPDPTKPQVDNHLTVTGSDTAGKLFPGTTTTTPTTPGMPSMGGGGGGLIATCQDWTSKEAAGGQPRAGLSWPRAGFGFPTTPTTPTTSGSLGKASATAFGGGGFSMDSENWISSWSLPGCEAGIELVEKGAPLPGETFIGAGGGYGGFYCFALNP